MKELVPSDKELVSTADYMKFKKFPAMFAFCPKCKYPYPEGYGASSREFEDIEVCSRCGYIEALEDYDSVERTGKRKYAY